MRKTITVTIHTPRPKTTLPAHEQAARRRRARTELPSLKKPVAPKPQPTSGRQTLSGAELYPFGLPNPGRTLAGLF